MKIETLARRIAKKANCPELTDYILNLSDDLPSECLIWQGTRSGGNGNRVLRRRGYELLMVIPSASCQIRFNNQRHQVNRLIATIRDQPSDTFRMKNRCDTPFCVNPKHWDIIEQKTEVEAPEIMDDSWTPQDVEEMLEILFTEYNPQSWDEIINAPLMDSAPAQMIIPILERWNKSHLLPSESSTR